MSFKTILGDIWKAVKGIGKFIATVLLDKNEEENTAYATYAVLLLQRIKNYTYNPLLNTVTDLIPGDWDIKLIEASQVVLTRVLDKTIEGQECMLKASFGEKLSCFLSMVDQLTPVQKSKVLNSFAVDLAGAYADVMSDGKITFMEIINKLFILVPAIYLKLFKSA